MFPRPLRIFLLPMGLLGLAVPAFGDVAEGRYIKKFQSEPCTNSFCLRSDPQVEQRHWRRTPRPVAHRDDPTPPAEGTAAPAALPPSAAGHPHPAPNRPVEPASDIPAAPPRPSGVVNIGGIPRMSYKPGRQFVFPAFDPASPPTQVVEATVTQGPLEITDISSEKQLISVKADKTDASHWNLSVRPNPGLTGTILDAVTFNQNLNKDRVRLPVRGWADAQVTARPGWWDMAAKRGVKMPWPIGIVLQAKPEAGELIGVDNPKPEAFAVEFKKGLKEDEWKVDIRAHVDPLPPKDSVWTFGLRFKNRPQPIPWRMTVYVAE